jgi:mono/diheme cytochrome c family protein
MRDSEREFMKSFALLAAILAPAVLAGCAVGKHVASSDTRHAIQSRAIERGRQQFRESCAGCHGADGHGTGPIAPLLNIPVPDLTRIAARREGRFPADEIYRIVDGQADLRAHGPRHMPVWGYEFFGEDSDDEAAHERATEKIERVVSYLRSIQR